MHILKVTVANKITYKQLAPRKYNKTQRQLISAVALSAVKAYFYWEDGSMDVLGDLSKSWGGGGGGKNTPIPPGFAPLEFKLIYATFILIKLYL